MSATLCVHDDIADVSAARWNALVESCATPTMFMRHEFLSALQRSGCTTLQSGWQPLFLTLESEGDLLAACALYLKFHSYGEYVFDWAWADAFEGAGLRYYPKLLCAAPFSPIPGSRLLAREPRWADALLQAMEGIAQERGLSSAHVLFLDARDQAVARQRGWLMREGVQFHWRNREPAPYANWEDFLSSLQRDKRKKIQQERRRVREAGVDFEVLRGTRIDHGAWDFFYRCYENTYHQHGALPYLQRAFFERVSRDMPEHWLLFVARRAGRRVACSLLGLDPHERAAYGRYWGAVEHIDCLHFEACYYQPLQWCIDEGWRVFQGGAQGEHKMARGLLPVATASAHWLRDPRFAQAVARHLQHEAAGMRHYVDELDERTPYRRPPRRHAARRHATRLRGRGAACGGRGGNARRTT